MSRVIDTASLRRDLQPKLFWPLRAAILFAFGVGIYFIGFEIPGFGPGPRSWLVAAIAAAFLSRPLGRCADDGRNGPDILFRMVLSAAWVWVFAFGGRILFTWFPPWDATVGVILGLVGGFSTLRYVRSVELPNRFVHRRGRQLKTAADVDQLLEARLPNPDVPAAPASGVSNARLGSPDSGGSNGASGPTAASPKHPNHQGNGHATNGHTPVNGAGPSVQSTRSVPAGESVSEPQTLNWAGKRMPWLSATGNFAVIGAAGSGKTLMHYELLRSVVPHLRPGSDRRVLFFDIKAEVRSQIEAMNPSCPVITMNPFDARAVAWDIGADLTDFDHLDDYVRPFVPQNPAAHDRFFADSARRILQAVFGMLIQRGPRWTLRHVVLMAQNADVLRVLITQDKTWGKIAGDRFQPEVTWQAVKQELDNALGSMRTVAKLWDRCGDRKMSLRKWMREESSIVLLGAPPNQAETTSAINRVMFELMADEARSRPASNGRDHFWFFIDELAEAGKINGLAGLLGTGRSKGVRAVVGFQTLASMHQAYGVEQTDAILGNFANTSMIRVECPKTADWCRQKVGRYDGYEYMQSGMAIPGHEYPQRPHTTLNESLTERDTVLASEFMDLPAAFGGVVHGFHIIQPFEDKIVFKGSVKYAITPARRENDFQPWQAASAEALRPWDDKDTADTQIDLPAAAAEAERLKAQAGASFMSPTPAPSVVDDLKEIIAATRRKRS